MPQSAWSYLLSTLTLPEDAGPDDPAIVIGPDLPPCMQSRYSSAILFRPPGAQEGAPYWFMAQRSNPDTVLQIVEFGFVRWTDTECGFVVYEEHICNIDDSVPPDHFASPRVFFGKIFKDGDIEWDAFPPSMLFINDATLQLLTSTTLFASDAQISSSLILGVNTFLKYQSSTIIDLGGAVSDETAVNTTYTSTSGSYTTSGATVVSVSCVAPPSGKIRWHFSGGLSNSTAGAAAYLSPQITGPGGTVLAANDNHGIFMNITAHCRVGASILSKGLTPGDTYTATLYHRVSSGTGTFSRRRLGAEPRYT